MFMEDKKREELREKHWAEIIADKVIAEKKEPFIITSGITTSGPAHLGTVCEFLYPHTIKQALEERGCKTEFYFIGDILDAFDSIPKELEPYENVLKDELGKPLANVKDPMNCHSSLGEHYLEEAKYVMKALDLNIIVEPVNELYDKGLFDPYARIFLKEEEKAKEIIARTSGKDPKSLGDWSPIMPICEKCGKIATTRVVWHNDEEYEYVCDKDVGYAKGCGYRGKGKISDHKYKLQWRLHWPAWQAVFNTSIEGGGVDHFTKGGSWDTAVAIHKEILKRDPPVGYKFGFVLFGGKKYSKSKGIGMGAREIIKILPPEIIKYMLIEPNIQQNKDITLEGEKLIKIFDEVERLSRIDKPEDRADQKKKLALKFATKGLKWHAPFVEVLLYYQVYKDWDKVSEVTKDSEGVKYLSPYIEEWLKRGLEPERYNFSIKQGVIKEHKEVAKYFAESLNSSMSAIEIHNKVYEVAKEKSIEPSALFKELYNALISKDNGPRLGKLIEAIGVEKAKQMILNAAASS